MFKNTLSSIKKVCTFAFLPRIWRGHIVKCTPKKFQKLPIHVSAVGRSPNTDDKDPKEPVEDVEKCKRILDYAFGNGEFPVQDIRIFPVDHEFSRITCSSTQNPEDISNRGKANKVLAPGAGASTEQGGKGEGTSAEESTKSPLDPVLATTKTGALAVQDGSTTELGALTVQAITNSKAPNTPDQAEEEPDLELNPQFRPHILLENAVNRAMATTKNEEELKQKMETIKEPSVVEAAETVEDKVPPLVPRTLSEKATYNYLNKHHSDNENSVQPATVNNASIDESTAERLMRNILYRSSEARRRRRLTIKSKMNSRNVGSSETEGKAAAEKRLLKDVEEYGVAQSVVKPDKTPILDMDTVKVSIADSILNTQKAPTGPSGGPSTPFGPKELGTELVDKSPIMRRYPKLKPEKVKQPEVQDEEPSYDYGHGEDSPSKPLGPKYSGIAPQTVMYAGATQEAVKSYTMPKIRATVKSGFVLTADDDKPSRSDVDQPAQPVTNDNPYFPYDPRSPLVADDDPFARPASSDQLNFHQFCNVFKPVTYEEEAAENDCRYEHLIQATETIRFLSDDKEGYPTAVSGLTELVQLKPLRSIPVTIESEAKSQSPSQYQRYESQPQYQQQYEAQQQYQQQYEAQPQYQQQYEAQPQYQQQYEAQPQYQTQFQSQPQPQVQSEATPTGIPVTWDYSQVPSWAPTQAVDPTTVPDWVSRTQANWDNYQPWEPSPQWSNSSKQWEQSGWSNVPQSGNNLAQPTQPTTNPANFTKTPKGKSSDKSHLNVPPSLHTTSTPLTDFSLMSAEHETFPKMCNKEDKTNKHCVADVFNASSKRTYTNTPQDPVRTIPEALERMRDEEIRAISAAEKSELLKSTATKIASVLLNNSTKSDNPTLITVSTPSRLAETHGKADVAALMKKLRTAYIVKPRAERQALSEKRQEREFDQTTANILTTSQEALQEEVEVTDRPDVEEISEVKPGAVQDPKTQFCTETVTKPEEEEIDSDVLERTFSEPTFHKIQANIPTTIGPMPVFTTEKEMPLSMLLKTVRLRHRLESYKAFLDAAHSDVGLEMKKCPDPCPPPPKTDNCPPKPCAPPPKPKCPPPTPKCPPPKKDPCGQPAKKKDPCGAPKKKNPCGAPKKKNPCAPKKKNPCAKYVGTETDFQFSLQDFLPRPSFLTYARPSVVFTLNDDGCYKDAQQCTDDFLNSIIAKEGADTVLNARGYEPWTPIPSWPVPKKSVKRLLLCPKDGCPQPGPLTDHQPCKPRGTKPCKGFPKQIFSPLDNWDTKFSWDL